MSQGGFWYVLREKNERLVSVHTSDDDDDDEYDDTKIVKTRVSGFSRAKLEAGVGTGWAHV